MITKAILLAGGRGSRLFPLTESIPKPLLPIDNIPALSRIFRNLERTGIRHATVTLGYLGDKIAARYGGIFRTLHLEYSREEKPLGTAGAVKAAALISNEEALPAFARNEKTEDAYLVLSGDALFEGDLSELIETHNRRRADVTIAAKEVGDVTGYGVILGKPSRIESFLEKPDPSTAPSHLVNTGIYVLSRRVLEEIPAGPYDFGRELFPALLRKGYTLCYHVYDDYWCDIGTPESFLSCNLRYSEGKTVLGNACRLAPTAKTRKSVFFDHVTLGDRSFAENSVLCEGVTLGEGVSVLSCVVGAGCELKVSPPPGSLVWSEGGKLALRPLETAVLPI